MKQDLVLSFREILKCPCKGCDYRKVGCHSKCNSYKAWKSNRGVINAERAQKSRNARWTYSRERTTNEWLKGRLDRWKK